MKRKITLLIIASIVGLIALSAVQLYLVNNTYQLKKDSFIKQTRDEVSLIDDHLTKIDSMRSEWRDYMIETAAEYKQGLIQRGQVLDRFGQKTAEMNPEFLSVLREVLKENAGSSRVQFHKKVRSIIILDSLQNDTLYSKETDSKSYILGDDFGGEEYELGQSTSYSEYTYTTLRDGREVSEMLRLNFETETLMNIEGRENGVLLQMKGFLLISTTIFLFVFGVLFYSIKNLITQKKIAEVKTDFINNISHEFKTPLTTLALATEMLRNEGKQHLDTIDIIERQNQKLQKLLDQVLDNSLNYSEIHLNKEFINAQDFLTALLDDFELAMQEVNMDLVREFNLKEEQILIDPFYLSTAISNMLENAVKYNERVPKLLFRATMDATMSIVIEDNGIGVLAKDQNNLFEKFYRAGNKETHDVKGLGLGLYYANQVVIAHGGSIVVKSSSGDGSVFTIELPLT
ncbi:MAG: HAMP domain-containing sensor histidine kinase [Ekhidna sp.]